MVVSGSDMELKVIYLNRTMMKLIRGKDGETYLNQNLENIWPNKNMFTLANKLKKGSAPDDVILPAFDENDETITVNEKKWVKLTIQDLNSGNDKLYALWAIDISASKIAEEKLKKAVEEADAAAQMKANFLATMSHEIRTPLQSVYGLLELIGDENPSAAISDMVQTAKTAASGLLEILDDILDIAKIDADRMELDNFEVPVRTLAGGVIEALHARFLDKKVKAREEIESGVPPVVFGDPTRLRQILMNLLGNAMKFTEKGSVTLKITTRSEELEAVDDQIILRFEIIDTGIGMSDQTLARLFTPFSQADNSTSRQFGGTGLGLSICKKLVELMDGKIGARSKEGEGSTFWFEIPTASVSVDATVLKLPKLDGLSVLSLEDHPKGAKEIVNSLNSMGAQVEHCSTIEEAKDLVSKRPFDVAIVDQGLPDGLGIDFIKYLMKLRPSTGLIMYTVRDDFGLQQTLKTIGVKYLSKPASRLGLGEAVKEVAITPVNTNIDGPRKILIAEDTPSVQDVLKRQMKKLGHDATFVDNGEQALKELTKENYGLVITDLHMPKMDGYELIKNIRLWEKEKSVNAEEEPVRLPVIVLTADVQLAHREVYMRHGFDECLLKPVTMGQLTRMLMRWGLASEEISLEEQEEIKEKEKEADTQKDEDPVNIHQISKMIGGDEDQAIEMLSMFVNMTTPLLDEISEASDNNDFHKLKDSAHSLKGAARSACAEKLGNLSANLQESAEKGCKDTQLVKNVLDEFERVRVQVSTLKSEKQTEDAV